MTRSLGLSLQVRVFTFSVGQHNYDVTPLQWIACANKGKLVDGLCSGGDLLLAQYQMGSSSYVAPVTPAMHRWSRAPCDLTCKWYLLRIKVQAVNLN